MVCSPASDLKFLPASANFIHHFPHMSAVGARQPPSRGRCSTQALEGVAMVELATTMGQINLEAACSAPARLNKIRQKEKHYFLIGRQLLN